MTLDAHFLEQKKESFINCFGDKLFKFLAKSLNM